MEVCQKTIPLLLLFLLRAPPAGLTVTSQTGTAVCQVRIDARCEDPWGAEQQGKIGKVFRKEVVVARREGLSNKVEEVVGRKG